MIAFGGVDLDPVELGINGNAILGIKESGKSYLGTELGEIFFDNDIPFVAFDPIGLWHNMRTPGRGKGYPIVVAGGFHGDIPLTAETAPAIVEAAMKKRVSLVLDLFHPELSKADWRKIVKDCAFLLLHKNAQYGLRHVFIEEAAEFVPQNPRDGMTYDAVERLIRMGGNSRLGCTLITPRSQEVNKAVLELCENLFLFRQRGKNALENLKKWLEIAGNDAKNIIATLPNLEKGECWAWLGGGETPILIKVPPKSSFHPDRRQMGADVVASGKKPVSASKFVESLQRELPKVVEEAAANDPAKLKAEIKRLEAIIAKGGPGAADLARIASLDAEIGRLRPFAVAIPAFRRAMDAAWKGLEGVQSAVDGLDGRMDNLELVLEPLAPSKAVARGRGEDPAPPVRGVIDPEKEKQADRISRRQGILPPAPPMYDMKESSSKRVAVSAEAQPVPSGCGKVLAVLAGAYPGGLTEGQLTSMAGYKKGGSTWREYRARLRRAGMIEQRDGLFFATAVGAASAGDVEMPPPAGPELAKWWTKKSQVPLKFIEPLLEAWPHRVSGAELAANQGIEEGGSTFREYRARLKRNNVVDQADGGLRLTTEMMGYGEDE